MSAVGRAGVLLILAIVMQAGTPPAAAAEFFVDCLSGDDSSDGRSPESPWGTLARVNELSLLPGDSILLRRGTTCVGAFRPGGSGSPDLPLTLASYGVGARP